MFVEDGTGICRLVFLKEKVRKKLLKRKEQWIRLSGQDLKPLWLVSDWRSGKQ